MLGTAILGDPLHRQRMGPRCRHARVAHRQSREIRAAGSPTGRALIVAPSYALTLLLHPCRPSHRTLVRILCAPMSSSPPLVYAVDGVSLIDIDLACLDDGMARISQTQSTPS